MIGMLYPTEQRAGTATNEVEKKRERESGTKRRGGRLRGGPRLATTSSETRKRVCYLNTGMDDPDSFDKGQGGHGSSPLRRFRRQPRYPDKDRSIRQHRSVHAVAPASITVSPRFVIPNADPTVLVSIFAYALKAATRAATQRYERVACEPPRRSRGERGYTRKVLDHLKLCGVGIRRPRPKPMPRETLVRSPPACDLILVLVILLCRYPNAAIGNSLPGGGEAAGSAGCWPARELDWRATVQVLADNVPLAQTQQVTRTELQRVAVSDLPGREGVMYKAVFLPGGKASKHTHPGDEFVYVLKGTLIVEPEGKTPVTLKAGNLSRRRKAPAAQH